MRNWRSPQSGTGPLRKIKTGNNIGMKQDWIYSRSNIDTNSQRRMSMTEKVMKGIEKPEDLEQLDMARLVVDMFHRIMVHYTLWFTEVEHSVRRPEGP